MKKNLLFVVAIFLATSMSAQMYVGAKFGYGFGANKYEGGEIRTDNTQEIAWGSMGQGLTFGAKAGYFFDDNWGFELGINYFMGAEQIKADYQYEQNMGPFPAFDVTVDVKAKSNQLRILPQLVYKSDLGIYGRFGIVIPVFGKTIVTHNSTTPMVVGTQVVSIKKYEVTEYKGQFSMGFAGALGYNYEIKEGLNLFAEIEYVGLTIRGNTSEVVESSINDNNNLTSMTTFDIETNYVDKLEESSNTLSNPKVDADKPADALRTSSVYSATRINIGVAMVF